MTKIAMKNDPFYRCTNDLPITNGDFPQLPEGLFSNLPIHIFLSILSGTNIYQHPSCSKKYAPIEVNPRCTPLHSSFHKWLPSLGYREALPGTTGIWQRNREWITLRGYQCTHKWNQFLAFSPFNVFNYLSFWVVFYCFEPMLCGSCFKAITKVERQHRSIWNFSATFITKEHWEKSSEMTIGGSQLGNPWPLWLARHGQRIQPPHLRLWLFTSEHLSQKEAADTSVWQSADTSVSRHRASQCLSISHTIALDILWPQQEARSLGRGE